MIKEDLELVGILPKDRKIARMNPKNYRVYDISFENEVELTNNIIIAWIIKSLIMCLYYFWHELIILLTKFINDFLIE